MVKAGTHVPAWMLPRQQVSLWAIYHPRLRRGLHRRQPEHSQRETLSLLLLTDASVAVCHRQDNYIHIYADILLCAPEPALRMDHLHARSSLSHN